MRKMFSFLLSAGFVGLAGNTALAANNDYGSTAAASIGIGLIIFWLIFMLISILFFAFWIWMLVDCVKRDFDQKVLWIILILVLGWIGAIAYYFVVRRKNGKASEITPTQTAPPVVQPPALPTSTPPNQEEPQGSPEPPVVPPAV